MKSPNFLIVGAAKSGTTALFEYLRQHPQIYLAPQKEISYFTGRMHNVIGSMNDYLRYFQGATNELAIGEASVAYLFSAEAAKNIYRDLGPNTKIIILLRNPVDMMYSLWGHNVRVGGESLSFKEALSAEKSRMEDENFHKHAIGWSFNYAYTARAKFSNQIKVYLDTFGEKQVRIYIYEEFFQNLNYWLREVFKFLEVDSSYRVQNLKRYNVMGVPRFRILQRILVQPTWWTYPLRRLLPNRIRQMVSLRLSQLNTIAKPLPRLDSQSRGKLTEQFMSDIHQVENYLHRSLRGIWY